MFVLIIFFLLEIPVLGEGGRICRRVPYKDGYVSYWPSGDGEMAVQKKKDYAGLPRVQIPLFELPKSEIPLANHTRKRWNFFCWGNSSRSLTANHFQLNFVAALFG